METLLARGRPCARCGESHTARRRLGLCRACHRDDDARVVSAVRSKFAPRGDDFCGAAPPAGEATEAPPGPAKILDLTLRAERRVALFHPRDRARLCLD